MITWTIIRVLKQIHGKVPSITQSEAQKPFSWKLSQTCIRQPLMGPIKSGPLGQVVDL